MSTRSPGDIPVRRIDRVLAFMSLGLLIVSVVCFFAVILAQPLGVTDFSQGLWPTVIVLPMIGLPVAFLLMLTVLIMSFVRRGRANRGR
ncbi:MULTISPECIES: multidrug ABC transporter ATPase [unclassified Microbacterium]|uniref:multidrug ABC transporter ATPase n=1 Tax=unclassified Microbacterium TaxID=2609290 RepID=UPI003744EE2D